MKVEEGDREIMVLVERVKEEGKRSVEVVGEDEIRGPPDIISMTNPGECRFREVMACQANPINSKVLSKMPKS